MSELIKPAEAIPAKLTPADELNAELVAQHRELARREFIARDVLRPVLRCDMLTLRDVEGEYLCPKVGAILNRLGVAWGQSAQEKDGSVYVHLYRDIPAELLRAAGVKAERPTREQYDELLRPYADKVAGHFSRAHTAVHYAYPFTTDYNPLETDSTNWTKMAGGSGQFGKLKAVGGLCQCNCGGEPEYINASVGTMATADYSVAATLYKLTGNHWDYFVAVTLRHNFTTSTQDWVRVQYNSLTSGNDFLIRRKVGGAASAALGAANVAGNDTAIMQAVGTQFEAFWGGVSKIDVADGAAPTSAYKTGLIAVSVAGNEPAFDDFTVYVAAAVAKAYFYREQVCRRRF